MKKEEKRAKFQELIDSLQSEFDGLTEKVKKCIEGSKQVKNQKEQQNLKALAQQMMETMRPKKALLA